MEKLCELTVRKRVYIRNDQANALIPWESPEIACGEFESVIRVCIKYHKTQETEMNIYSKKETITFSYIVVPNVRRNNFSFNGEHSPTMPRSHDSAI